MLRSLGAFAACLSKATCGAMPADHETIRIWGLSGGKTQDDFFLFREVLGAEDRDARGLTGPMSCTSCRIRGICPPSLPKHAIRFLSSNWDLNRIPAAPAFAAVEFGYDKRIRTLVEARLISNADRSALGCFGVNGGKAGQPYGVAVTSLDGGTVDHPGMCDTVIVRPDSSIRIVTTGGGGWGDPLLREVDKVVYDVQCGLVSAESATEDYGVILSKVARKWQADLAKTDQRRRQLASLRGKVPMFDRGPHFESQKRLGRVKYPEGWTDPDLGWYANSVLEQDVA